MRKYTLGAVFALLGLLLAPIPASADSHDQSQALQDAVTLDAVRGHQQVLQDIADANGGTRAGGTAGYDLSADYVQQQLEAAGYQVERPEFQFNFFEETAPTVFEQVAPTPITYADQEDFDTMTFSGSGSVTGPVTAADLSLADPAASSSGCEPEDFDGFPAGDIALVQRGACSFAQKAQNAEAAGAIGVVIFNQGNTEEREGLLFGTLGGPGATIPVLGTTFAVGEALAVEGASASIEVSAISETRTTTNVIATSTTGDPDNVVMAGAHLDSVPVGPGVQDNGTGSAAILEIALQLAEDFGVNDSASSSLTNTVRFGWWGAEEFGLLGSIDYVVNLPADELAKIAVYQNYDMIGSPNFARFVYDGDGSDVAPTIAVPASSATLEKVYLDYYASRGLPSQATLIGQRSDHFAFCVSGIACGGLFTGAEGIKTAEEVALYGGVEGEQYDQCYHAACDTFDNISLTALDQNADAAAHAMATYAFSILCNGLPATIVGSPNVDNIQGTDGDDVIASLGGNDLVNGGGGNDTICLGDGQDKGNGGSGMDTILGEGGNDEIRGDADADIIDGGDGNDRLLGGDGDDNIIGGNGSDSARGGDGEDIMSGGDGNDDLSGDDDNDSIDGGDGRDIIRGGLGDDQISGGDGNDQLLGQAGNDTLDGGDDFDNLFGGDGTDTCQNGEKLLQCETDEEVEPQNFAADIATTRGSGGGGGGGGGAGGLAADHHHDHDHNDEVS